MNTGENSKWGRQSVLVAGMVGAWCGKDQVREELQEDGCEEGLNDANHSSDPSLCSHSPQDAPTGHSFSVSRRSTLVRKTSIVLQGEALCELRVQPCLLLPGGTVTFPKLTCSKKKSLDNDESAQFVLQPKTTNSQVGHCLPPVP